MAARKWDLLSREQQTAGLVSLLDLKYWGWFDMVSETRTGPENDDRPVAMTLPEGIECGAPVERWTAWEFPDGSIRAARSELLAIAEVEVSYPTELECACLPHKNGLDWFLIRERDKAMANIIRGFDHTLDLTSTTVQ